MEIAQFKTESFNPMSFFFIFTNMSQFVLNMPLSYEDHLKQVQNNRIILLHLLSLHLHEALIPFTVIISGGFHASKLNT